MASYQQRYLSPTSTTKLLESRTLALFAAMNDRNFNLSLPPWTYVAPKNFACTLDRHGLAEPTTASDLSNNWREWCVVHPKFHMQCSREELHTKLDERGGFAEVWANLTSTGEVEGVEKDEVAKFVWVKGEDGEWRVTYMQTFVGMGGSLPF